MIVDVYWNTHRKLWSVRRHNGTLYGHAEAVLLHDARFIVRKAGRKRVIESGCKNVHAFVTGNLAVMAGVSMNPDFLSPSCNVPVRYNPKDCETFKNAMTGEPIYEAKKALFLHNRRVLIPGSESSE